MSALSSVSCSATAPPPPEGLDTAKLFAEIPRWHQRWEVFQGVFTPGASPIGMVLDKVGLPRDLGGLRVLDVGANSGCASFECERRGAAEVVAVDLRDPHDSGFFLLRDLLASKVRYQKGSVYDLSRATLGEFDVVLFLGVLYHLRHPLLGLDRLRAITRGTLYLESLVIDDRVIEGGKDFQALRDYHPALTDIPLWQFYKGAELAKDPSNWFGPNIRAVIDALESAGFTPRLQNAWGDRAAFQAGISAVPVDLSA